MIKRYINTFSQEEINIFNMIESDKVRISTMSVYSYFIKLFAEKDTANLKISLDKFLKRYNRYHTKICKDTLAKRVSFLVKNKLLSLTKLSKGQEYTLTRISDNKSDEETDNNNPPPSADISSVDKNLEKPKDETTKKQIYNKYLSASETDDITNMIIKELCIKRDVVKCAIKLRVKYAIGRINPEGAVAYITKIAISVIEFFRLSATKANKILCAGKKSSSNKNKTNYFSNYSQRNYTPEQQSELEEALYLDASSDWSTEF